MLAARSTSAELQEFHAADHALRLFRGQIGLLLGMVMMPAGFALDWFFYPQLLWQLFGIRVATAVFLAAGWAILQWAPLGKWLPLVSLAIVLIPGWAMSLMIFQTDAEASTYFVGLILMTIVIQLLGFSALEAAMFCSLTIAAYLLAVFGARGWASINQNQLALALFFLVTTSVISVVICHLNMRNRLTEFLLRRSLDEKNQQLEELDRLRAGFLANVSHELRTPLSLIIAPLEEILATRTTVTPEMGQTLGLVRKNADRLRLLVDDLLDVVRLDHGMMKLDVEEVDARDFLANIVRTLSPLAEDRNIRLLADLQTEPVELRIDTGRVERVLMNLISNSLKFSPEQTTVRVELTARDRAAVITVRDEGPGIPEADRVQIFDRFFQASNNRARASQGLGLGLAISREIVREHGGEIEVENNVGPGCRFVMTLPREFHPAQHLPAPPEKQETAKLSNGTIPSLAEITAAATAAAVARALKEGPVELLIVDDEPDLRNYLLGSLQSEFVTLAASSVATGWAAARDHAPACVLLDLMLPDGSGLDVLQAIRDEPALRDTKVVMLTANLDETVKIDALKIGADDFLSKPFGITEVRTRVANLVRSSQLQGQLRREREELQAALVRLRETETKLFQSEKMRGLGSLAAGLLHEINNPVHYTSLAIKSLKKDLSAGRDPSEVVNDIEDGVRRIGQIIGELRAFAYPEQAPVDSEVSLNAAIRTALRFTAHLTSDIAISAPADEPTYVARGSEIQIGQVLVNLITNATDAIRRRQDKVAGRIAITVQRRGERVVVSIADNGCGIPAADLSRVCEPFYSTAAPGSGLGLGLSICDTIVRQHGGHLTIHSTEQVGTAVSSLSTTVSSLSTTVSSLNTTVSSLNTTVSFDLPLVPLERYLHDQPSLAEADSVRR